MSYYRPEFIPRCERNYATIGEVIKLRAMLWHADHFFNPVYKFYKRKGNEETLLGIDIFSIPRPYSSIAMYRIPDEDYQQNVAFYSTTEYDCLKVIDKELVTVHVGPEKSKECIMYIGKLGEPIPTECDIPTFIFGVS